MNWRSIGHDMLVEYSACCHAKPYHNAIDVEIIKENCAKYAINLNSQLSWGSEQDIAEACQNLEPRLKKFKEIVVLDILKK